MRPANDFNPDADAKALRKAMKGLGEGTQKGQGWPLGQRVWQVWQWAGQGQELPSQTLVSLSLRPPECREEGREGVCEELDTSPSQTTVSLARQEQYPGVEKSTGSKGLCSCPGFAANSLCTFGQVLQPYEPQFPHVIK